MTVIRTSRQLDAKPEAVFAAIRDPVRLARWWGPDGFTNSFAVFEFKPGGRWQFVMHGPDGANYPNQAEFAEIVPNSLHLGSGLETSVLGNLGWQASALPDWSSNQAGCRVHPEPFASIRRSIRVHARSCCSRHRWV